MALLSFAVTMVSLLVLYNIITKLDEERSFAAITIYSIGIATGTILGTKMKIDSKDKKS